MRLNVDDWIFCKNGRGWKHGLNGHVSNRIQNFPKMAVGQVRKILTGRIEVYFIGSGEVWDIKAEDVTKLNLKRTGDQFKRKVCNRCHCLLPTKHFAINQRNKDRQVRRPTCADCRTGIDKRAPKTSQAKAMAKKRPKLGQVFECPICMKRSIARVTAKIVADHNHHTGDIRDFICDSCNTGLGRFKNGENYLQNAIDYLKQRDPEEAD